MARALVECLRCGRARRLGGSRLLAVRVGACPGCGYLGWAFAEELSEDERRALREVPVERRRRLPAGGTV
jgi:hypothetical protein